MINDYYESLRVPKSSLWPQLLGEILLKGWTAPLDTPPPVRSRRDRGGDESRPAAADAVRWAWGSGPVSRADYVSHAVVLLGKLREQRACVRVLRILQDEKKEDYEHQDQRTVAARVLGWLRYRQAVETLLVLAESNETLDFLRSEAFKAVGEIGDARALPALERIAAWPTIKEAGGRDPGQWASWARTAIRQIRGEAQ